MKRRQRPKIFFEEWLNSGQLETADEKEGEIAGVGETILIESHRLFEVPFIDRFRRIETAPQMVLISGRQQRIRKLKRGNGGLICDRRLRRGGLSVKGVHIRARLCESQEDELEHRLQIPL